MSRLEKIYNVQVAVVDGFAYWVENNILYKVKLNSDGNINPDIAEPVDVMSMSEKEINKITKIVDSINN